MILNNPLGICIAKISKIIEVIRAFKLTYAYVLLKSSPTSYDIPLNVHSAMPQYKQNGIKNHRRYNLRIDSNSK